MLYMNLILLTCSITAGWALLHSNSIVLKHVPDVRAYYPQALVCTAANISFLLIQFVVWFSSFFLPHKFSTSANSGSFALWGPVVVLMVLVKQQLNLSIFSSHNLWVYFCAVSHPQKSSLSWSEKSLTAAGIFITNLQVVGWTVKLTGDGSLSEVSH